MHVQQDQAEAKRMRYLLQLFKIVVFLLVIFPLLGACGSQSNGSVSDGTGSRRLGPPYPTKANKNAQPSSAATLPDEVYDPGQKAEIARIRQELLRSDITIEMRRTLEEKLAILERQVQQRATTLARSQRTKPKDGRPTPLPEDKRAKPPLGILSLRDAPFGWDVIVMNRWQGWYDKRNEILLQAFAGAEEKTPQQGVLVLSTLPSTPKTGGYYPTPTKNGAIRVTAYHGNILVLEAVDGTEFMFDLDSRTFIDKSNRTDKANTTSP